MKPDFPAAWDSSMRHCFVSCPRKFELQYLNHWKPSGTSVHLHAGGAFAFGIETVRRAFYEGGLEHTEAIIEGVKALMIYYGKFEAPEDSAKTVYGMCQALVYYFDHFGTQTDYVHPAEIGGKRAIEFTFALPLHPNLRHPITGDPILYTGRFDMLGDYQAGPNVGKGFFPTDEKTTGQMGKLWANQWKLKSQFTGYTWATREYGYKSPGVLVRGISIQKTDIKFGEYIAFRPEWMVARWHYQLVNDISRAIKMWKEGYWDYALDHACSDFGGCAFLEVCTSNSPERWLEANFDQVKWDPMKRVEIPLKKVS